jgi:hypothetical protein
MDCLDVPMTTNNEEFYNLQEKMCFQGSKLETIYWLHDIFHSFKHHVGQIMVTLWKIPNHSLPPLFVDDVVIAPAQIVGTFLSQFESTSRSGNSDLSLCQ